MTQYAFTITRTVTGQRKKDTSEETTVSSWRDSLDETKEMSQLYRSMLQFAPWIKSMTIIDDKENELERWDNARHNR